MCSIASVHKIIFAYTHRDEKVCKAVSKLVTCEEKLRNDLKPFQ